MNIFEKRIYDAPSSADGQRILVDRLWPRGIKKQDANITAWPKEITPSNELRKWYHEDIEQRWEAFRERYLTELAQYASQREQLQQLALTETITCVTAAKNQGHNHVTVLIEWLKVAD